MNRGGLVSRPEGLSKNVRFFMIPCLEWKLTSLLPIIKVASGAAKKDEDVLRVLCWLC